jgi:hypothetical protein
MEPEIRKMLVAIAAREVALASLLDSVSKKLDTLTLYKGDQLKALSELREMTTEILQVTAEIDKTHLNTLSFLLHTLDDKRG